MPKGDFKILLSGISERKKIVSADGADRGRKDIRFALYHAKKFKKRRILYVAPFNSILEQNAAEIRKAVGEESDVLEHHCNVCHDDTEKEEIYKKLTESWDSPIIVTTAVQMLNTLFSGQKSSIPIGSMSLFNLSTSA